MLFVLHRDWLRDNPGEEKWCMRILDQLLANPPDWPKFDMPESVGNSTWEDFACEIAPVILADNPNDKKALERVARLVFVRHYSAAGILMSRAFELRDVIGNRFWQLLNLMLEWSAVSFQIRNPNIVIKKNQYVKVV